MQDRFLWILAWFAALADLNSLGPDQGYWAAGHATATLLPVLVKASDLFVSGGPVQAERNVHAEQPLPPVLPDAIKSFCHPLVAALDLLWRPRRYGDEASGVLP